MADLIVRPSAIDPKRPWVLQLRFHECVGPTEYVDLKLMSDDMAKAVLNAGAPFPLFANDDPRLPKKRTQK
jgi:hypothetical protein